MIIACDKRGFETRHDSGIFFLIIYIFNYTNEFLKALCLRMETSGLQERDMGAGDAFVLFFFFLLLYPFFAYFLQISFCTPFFVLILFLLLICK